MLNIAERVLKYSLLLFVAIDLHAQSQADSVFRQLNEEQRLALLFLSPDNAAYDFFEVVDPASKDVKGKIVDLSSGFADSTGLTFPGYDVLKCISDTLFTEYFYENTCCFFALKGAKGVLFKSPGKRCSGTYKRYLMTFTGEGFTVKEIAVFDDMPLLKTIDNHPADDKQEPSFTNQHYDFKNWIELFSENDDDLQVSFEELLKKGFLFYTDHPAESIQKLKRAIDNNVLDSSFVMRYAKEALELRLRIAGKDKCPDENIVIPEQKRLRWAAWVKTMSIVSKDEVSSEHSFMLNNASYGILDIAGFFKDKGISKYTSPGFIVQSDSLAVTQDKVHQLVVVVSDNDSIDDNRLEELNSKYILKLVFLGSTEKFRDNWLDRSHFFEKMLFAPEGINEVDKLLEQAMFGGIEVKGSFPFYETLRTREFKKAEYEKTRLGYAFPELAWMNSDSLKKIDPILKEIVKKKMSPGGQLLIARNGYVIYDKAFGYTTYAKKQKVDHQDLYDLASLTKIIVTIPLVMKLYEDKKIELDRKLKDYLPETDTTEAGSITIRKMLLHEAGLPSYIPFHLNYVDKSSFRGSMYSGRFSRTYNIRLDKHFFFNKNVRYRKDVFSHQKDSVFDIRISKNMYMNHNFRDSVYSELVNVKLHKKKEYRYSDLGYYFLQKIIERQTGKSIDLLFKQWFATPLGTDHLVYDPLKYFPVNEIVPSGKDAVFRKEMLQGYVNDAGAAMMGGVAGHAGLFGNADDIAKFAQMLLNKGSYGGVKFIEPSTVELFTSKQNDHNRRGLGFDKPEFDPEKDSPVCEYASRRSFGHSGFTGTLLWIDPEYDLIYIFLSNRVYPNSYNRKLIEENIRTKIQDIIYRSFLSEH